jgi:hypothetical protein
MNYNQFVTAFPKLDTDKSAPAAEAKAERPEGEVVLVGTVMVATGEACHIDVNGAYYELSPKDVFDIQVLTTAERPPAATAETKPPEGKAKGAAGKAPPAPPTPPLALIKMRRNAVLCRRLQVPAAMLATAGTWMQVVPAAAK